MPFLHGGSNQKSINRKKNFYKCTLFKSSVFLTEWSNDAIYNSIYQN